MVMDAWQVVYPGTPLVEVQSGRGSAIRGDVMKLLAFYYIMAILAWAWLIALIVLI
jgi:hypothetical protein